VVTTGRKRPMPSQSVRSARRRGVAHNVVGPREGTRGGGRGGATWGRRRATQRKGARRRGAGGEHRRRASRTGRGPPAEFVYLGRSGTLWSWPGQNPYRWRDPSGRDGVFIGLGASGAWWPAGGELALGLFIDFDSKTGDVRIGMYDRFGWNGGVGGAAGWGVETGYMRSFASFNGYGTGATVQLPGVGYSGGVGYGLTDGSGCSEESVHAITVGPVSPGFRVGAEQTLTQTTGIRWSRRDDDWLPF